MLYVNAWQLDSQRLDSLTHTEFREKFTNPTINSFEAVEALRLFHREALDAVAMSCEFKEAVLGYLKESAGGRHFQDVLTDPSLWLTSHTNIHSWLLRFIKQAWNVAMSYHPDAASLTWSRDQRRINSILIDYLERVW